MALEAVVFAQDPFAYSLGDQYQLCHPLCGLPIDERSSSSSMFGLLDDVVDHNPNSSSPETCTIIPTAAAAAVVDPHNLGEATGRGGGGRRKRRRSRSGKNKEEMENQRMTHIAVERNRRKQMNEYLGVLRSLMPPSYSQRGDQASIIGGAINFVKELEHLLQSMESSHKRTQPDDEEDETNGGGGASSTTLPFADFFAFPQYSTRSADNPTGADGRRLAVADIEVTMVESHANIKVLVRKRARQLLKLVAGLQTMRMSILHLNVTSHEDSVLYSASVKVEEGCHLNSVDEIAAAVHELLRKIEQEAGLFS